LENPQNEYIFKNTFYILPFAIPTYHSR